VVEGVATGDHVGGRVDVGAGVRAQGEEMVGEAIVFDGVSKRDTRLRIAGVNRSVGGEGVSEVDVHCLILTHKIDAARGIGW